MQRRCQCDVSCMKATTVAVTLWGLWDLWDLWSRHGGDGLYR